MSELKSYLVVDFNNKSILVIATYFDSLLRKIREIKNLDSIKEIKLLEYPTYV